MKEKLKNIIPLLLLLGFVFNFAHSELDFLTPEGDTSHYAHEFCQLTKAFNNSTGSHSFIQKNMQPHFPLVCILPETNHYSNLLLEPFVKIQHENSGKGDIPIFVINRTLLI